jgi:hypothetical protein
MNVLVIILLVILAVVLAVFFILPTGRMEGGGGFRLPPGQTVTIVRPKSGASIFIPAFVIFGENHSFGTAGLGYTRDILRVLRNISRIQHVKNVVLYVEIRPTARSIRPVPTLIVGNMLGPVSIEEYVDHIPKFDAEFNVVRCDLRPRMEKDITPKSARMYAVQQWMTDIVGGPDHPLWQDRDGHRKIFNHMYHPNAPGSPISVDNRVFEGMNIRRALESSQFHELYNRIADVNYLACEWLSNPDYDEDHDRMEQTPPHSVIAAGMVEMHMLTNLLLRASNPETVSILLCGEAHSFSLQLALEPYVTVQTWKGGEMCPGEDELIASLNNVTYSPKIQLSRPSAIHIFDKTAPTAIQLSTTLPVMQISVIESFKPSEQLLASIRETQGLSRAFVYTDIPGVEADFSFVDWIPNPQLKQFYAQVFGNSPRIDPDEEFVIPEEGVWKYEITSWEVACMDYCAGLDISRPDFDKINMLRCQLMSFDPKGICESDRLLRAIEGINRLFQMIYSIWTPSNYHTLIFVVHPSSIVSLKRHLLSQGRTMTKSLDDSTVDLRECGDSLAELLTCKPPPSATMSSDSVRAAEAFTHTDAEPPWGLDFDGSIVLPPPSDANGDFDTDRITSPFPPIENPLAEHLSVL